MQLQIGMVVCAAAGKEQNQLFVITRIEPNLVCLADGKRRTLEKPKRKNPKHVRPTRTIWDLQDMTDRKLRGLLREHKGGN